MVNIDGVVGPNPNFGMQATALRAAADTGLSAREIDLVTE